MNTKEKQNFYFYYILENSSYNFLYSVKSCKSPRLTKEYKKLKFWLQSNSVYSIGWCTSEYFQDHITKFIAPNLTYLKTN